jgi:hypothetical protein
VHAKEPRLTLDLLAFPSRRSVGPSGPDRRLEVLAPVGVASRRRPMPRGPESPELVETVRGDALSLRIWEANQPRSDAP